METLNAAAVSALFASADSAEIEELAKRYAEDPRRQVQAARERALRRLVKDQAEERRVRDMYDYMRSLSAGGIAIGVDEVGRGAIAGPLTVCAVALPDSPLIFGLNDSKQLSPERRNLLAARIEQIALAIGICHIEPAHIDRVGMAVAIREAMAAAVLDAEFEPSAVLIDGNPVHIHPLEQTIVKGDAKVACIAAASIYAKVTRDALMVEYASIYPEYHFDECKGYGSAAHIEAIREHGLSPIHRRSFCGNFLPAESLF